MSLTLIIQVIDFYPWYCKSSRVINNRTFETSLKSEEWKIIASSVKHIIIIPPINQNDPKNNFTFYAANNQLDINIGNSARENTPKRLKYKQELMKEFNNNILHEDSLYVVNKNNLILPSERNKEKYLFGILDNYYIIVPKALKLKLDIWF